MTAPRARRAARPAGPAPRPRRGPDLHPRVQEPHQRDHRVRQRPGPVDQHGLAGHGRRQQHRPQRHAERISQHRRLVRHPGQMAEPAEARSRRTARRAVPGRRRAVAQVDQSREVHPTGSCERTPGPAGPPRLTHRGDAPRRARHALRRRGPRQQERGVRAGHPRPAVVARVHRGGPDDFRGILGSMRLLWPELPQVDLFRTVPEIKVPVFFVAGRYDRECPCEIAERYFESVTAPSKELIWLTFGPSAQLRGAGPVQPPHGDQGTAAGHHQARRGIRRRPPPTGQAVPAARLPLTG